MSPTGLLEAAKGALTRGGTRRKGTVSSDPENTVKATKKARAVFKLHGKMTPRSRRAVVRTLSSAKLISSSSSEGRTRGNRMADDWEQTQKKLLARHSVGPGRYDFPSELTKSVDESYELSGAALPVPVAPARVTRSDLQQVEKIAHSSEMARLEQRLIGLEMDTSGATENMWGAAGVPLNIPERVEIDARCQASVSNLMNIAEIVRKPQEAVNASSKAYLLSAGDAPESALFSSRCTDLPSDTIPALVEPIQKINPGSKCLPHIEGYISEARAKAWIQEALEEQSKQSGRLSANGERSSVSRATSNRSEKRVNAAYTGYLKANLGHEQEASDNDASFAILGGRSSAQNMHRTVKQIACPENLKSCPVSSKTAAQSGISCCPHSSCKGKGNIARSVRSIRHKIIEEETVCSAHKNGRGRRAHDSSPDSSSSSGVDSCSTDRSSCGAKSHSSRKNYRSGGKQSGISGSEADSVSRKCACISNSFNRSCSRRKAGQSENKSVIVKRAVGEKLSKCCAAEGGNSRCRVSKDNNRCRDHYSVRENITRCDHETRRNPCARYGKRLPPVDDSSDDSEDESDDYAAVCVREDEPCTQINKECSAQLNNNYGSASVKRMTFHQAVTYIPYFDGDPDSLNLFCDAVREVLTTYGPQHEKFLLLHIANRLKGKATEGYRARTANYSSVEALLRDLTLHYANIGIADQIYNQIRTINQSSGESAGEYGLRVGKLYNRLRTIVGSAPDLSSADRELRMRQADIDVLEQFLFGLRPPLDHLVRSKQPKNLDAAITTAIEFEGKRSARIATFNAAPAAGATAQVRLATATETEPPRAPTAGPVQTDTAAPANQSAEEKYCNYCRTGTHALAECRTLLRHAANNMIKRPYNNRNGGGRRWNDNRANNNDSGNRGNNQSNNNNANNNHDNRDGSPDNRGNNTNKSNLN